MPAHAHCDTFYVQDLRSSAQTYQLPSQMQQNLAGDPSDLSTSYTVYPHTDMHNALDLRPAAAPCCVPGAANASAVQTCAAFKGLCCVALADLGANAVRQPSCSCSTQAACSSCNIVSAGLHHCLTVKGIEVVHVRSDVSCLMVYNVPILGQW